MVSDIVNYLKLSAGHRTFHSEILTLCQLLLVMPASNASSERSFSVMRRIKSYLRNSMNQSRLNHAMILSIYKERVDAIDINDIANQFIQGNEHRLKVFGKFDNQ